MTVMNSPAWLIPLMVSDTTCAPASRAVAAVLSLLPSSTHTIWANADRKSTTTSPMSCASLNAGTTIQTPEVSMRTTYTLFERGSGSDFSPFQSARDRAARWTAMPTMGPQSSATTVRVSSSNGSVNSAAAAIVAPTQPIE